MTEKENFVRNWLVKAEHDLRIVRTQREQPDAHEVSDGICFHCQQAAEKSLKAYLT